MKWIFFVIFIFILGCSTGEQAADDVAGTGAGGDLADESGLEEVEALEIEDEEIENLDEDLTLLEDL